jgi:hypothetical protein
MPLPIQPCTDRAESEVERVLRQRLGLRTEVHQLHLPVHFRLGGEACFEVGTRLARTLGELGIVEVGCGRVVLAAGRVRIRCQDFSPPAGAWLHFENRHAGLQPPERQRFLRMTILITRLVLGAARIAVDCDEQRICGRRSLRGGRRLRCGLLLRAG